MVIESEAVNGKTDLKSRFFEAGVFVRVPRFVLINFFKADCQSGLGPPKALFLCSVTSRYDLSQSLALCLLH